MLCWGKVKLTGPLRRLTSSGDIFANEVVRFENLSMQEAPNWITCLFNISAREDLRHTRCGPAAHAGVFRHLSLHRGWRCAAARTAYCLQGKFGKLCGRTPQYAVSLLRGMTFSLTAFKNQRGVSDELFGLPAKALHCRGGVHTSRHWFLFVYITKKNPCTCGQFANFFMQHFDYRPS